MHLRECGEGQDAHGGGLRVRPAATLRAADDEVRLPPLRSCSNKLCGSECAGAGRVLAHCDTEAAETATRRRRLLCSIQILH